MYRDAGRSLIDRTESKSAFRMPVSKGFGWLTRPGFTFDESKPKSVPNLIMGQRYSFSGGSEAINVVGNLKMTSKQRRLHRAVSQWTYGPGSVSHPDFRYPNGVNEDD